MPTKYDLNGQDGIQVFNDLPEGVTVTLTDGSVGTIVHNPRNGGFIQVKYTSHPNASQVGEEEFIFFNQVAKAEG